MWWIKVLAFLLAIALLVALAGGLWRQRNAGGNRTRHAGDGSRATTRWFGWFVAALLVFLILAVSFRAGWLPLPDGLRPTPAHTMLPPAQPAP